MPTDNNISSNPASAGVVTEGATTLDTSESMTDDDIPF